MVRGLQLYRQMAILSRIGRAVCGTWPSSRINRRIHLEELSRVSDFQEEPSMLS